MPGRGDASYVTGSVGDPISRSAASAGFAMVAEAVTTTGVES